MKTHSHSGIWLFIMRFGPRILPTILLASVLAGCGQKGPLRLPDETPVAIQQN